jgi:hypothetical protein
MCEKGAENDGFLHLVPLGVHCVLSFWSRVDPSLNLAP